MFLNARRITIIFKGDDHCFDMSDTQESVMQKLGQPFDTDVVSSGKDKPSILVYDENERVEFHFSDNKLWLIHQENEHGVLFTVTFA